jgi:hypothetical protein
MSFLKLTGLCFCVFFSYLTLSWFIKSQPESSFSIQENLLPGSHWNKFHFGFQYSLSDLFWLRAIQDLDYCENKDLDRNCVGKVWLFEVLNLVTSLDPWYRMAYSAGGIGLSIVISDISGASFLFNKAVRYYPRDWVILYKAAYHAVYEEKNMFKGARLLEQSARSGAPQWVFALASRIYSDQGQKELGARILQDAKSLGLSDSLVREIEKRLAP